MRKFVIVLIVFFSISTFVKASDMFGGEITARYINNTTYEVNLILYRDVSGIIMSATRTITIRNNSTGETFNVTAGHSGAVIYSPMVERYIFTYSVTFPQPGEYEISTMSCCRSSMYNNFINPSGQSFAIRYILTVDPSKQLNPPVFINSPIVVAAVNDTLFYNPLPFDADCDSLVYSFVTPYETYMNSSNYQYLLNYTLPSSSSGGQMTINLNTGEIKWHPNLIGAFLACILVEEFRSGIKIGEIRRDMGFIVKNFLNNTETITNTTGWPVDWNNDFYFNLTLNTPFTLQISSTDNNLHNIFMESAGEALLLQNNPATFVQTVNVSGSSTGEFNWIPSINDQRSKPYIQVFRIKEVTNTDTLMRDITVQLFVGNHTSVNDIMEGFSNINIYPNPSTGDLFIQVNVEKSTDLELTFVNQLGQDVKKLDKKLNTGQNLLYFNNLDLPSGIYFVNVKMDDQLQVRKFIIGQ